MNKNTLSLFKWGRPIFFYLLKMFYCIFFSMILIGHIYIALKLSHVDMLSFSINKI